MVQTNSNVAYCYAKKDSKTGLQTDQGGETQVYINHTGKELHLYNSEIKSTSHHMFLLKGTTKSAMKDCKILSTQT